MLTQVEKAINIFERKCHKWATGLFLFDNAPTHQQRAADTLSARKMPKRPSPNWRHHKDGPQMRNGTLPDGSSQPFYFPDDHPDMPGWFKVRKVQFILLTMLTKSSRVWSRSSRNGTSGRPQDSMLSATASSVSLAVQIVVVAGFFLPSRILWPRSRVLKSMLSLGVICATFTRSSIVN